MTRSGALPTFRGDDNQESVGDDGNITTLGIGAVPTDPATVAAAEHGNDVVHRTVLTLTNLSVSVVGASGVGFGGALMYTFPEGYIRALGVTMDLTFDTDSGDLDDADGGDVGIGTAILTDADLGDATDVDLMPSSSVDPLSDGVTGVLGAPAQFDGTSIAKTANLNILIDDADIAATEILLVSGTVEITWANLGNY